MMNYFENIVLFLIYGKNFKVQVIKTYSCLRKKKLHQLFYKIKFVILNKNISSFYEDQSKGLLNLNYSYHQFIYSYLIHTRLFNITLLSCLQSTKKKFIFPLSKDYLDVINQYKKVNFSLSLVFWYFFLFLNFLYNLLRIVLSIIYFFKLNRKKNKNKSKVYFNNLPFTNYKTHENNNEFIDFFYRSFNLKTENTEVFFRLPKKLKNQPLQFNNLHSILSSFFCIKDIIDYFLCIIKIFKCISIFVSNLKFINYVILLYEIFIFHIFLETKKNFNYVIFNNSDNFRPLWTYANEYNSKGSVILYFYSTNYNYLSHYNSREIFYNISPLNLYNWPKYIVWSKKHVENLKKILQFDFKHIYLGNIPYEGKKFNIINNLKKKVAIFDVPVLNSYNYSFLINPYNIYTSNYVLKFFNDIMYVANKFDFEFFVKIKRKLSKDRHDKKYLSYLEYLKKKNNITIYDGTYSAASLLEYARASISIPFSTTALIAQNLNVKSIYYDPFNNLDNTFNYNENVNLIGNIKDLERWMSKI